MQGTATAQHLYRFPGKKKSIQEITSRAKTPGIIESEKGPHHHSVRSATPMTV